jgi:hypothetical protein
MKRMSETSQRISRRTTLAALAGGVASITACGGGGSGGLGIGIAGLSSGGTGSFTTGTVAGLGSIIVNGVRYDDSVARVSRSDDGPVAALRVGMVVFIKASAVASATNSDALPTATANRIVYASEWMGPVGTIDVVNRAITVLGQWVDVPAAVVFEGAALQFSELTTSQFVEVHGYLDVSTGRLLATRVEVSTGAPVAFRLTGKVSALNTSARTFSVGSALIAYDATSALPASWANGRLVRVTLSTVQTAGAWRATRIRARDQELVELEVKDRFDSELQGTVTSIEGPARFAVNGIPVDASAAQVTGTITVGAAVEVRGVVASEVIVARRVELRTGAALEVDDFDFFGTVSNLDTAARTFTLKGLVFAYTPGTRNEVRNWIAGSTPSVRVRATLAAGVWIASEIKPQT